MPTRISVNGAITDESSATISVLDRGFLYGDSIYEVMRTYGGEPWALEAHLGRLERSASLLHMSLHIDRELIVREMLATIAAAGNEESYVRIVITRGAGPISLDPALAGEPCRVIIVTELRRPAPELYERGAALHVARDSSGRSAAAVTGGAKSGNYLPNILALAEARENGAHEAVLLDLEGNVSEGASSNIFARFGDELATPPLTPGILEGITRAAIIAIAAERGAPVVERSISPEQLAAADEVFITSTIREVLPITRIDGAPIADGKPGRLARDLRLAYRDKVGAHWAPRAGTPGGAAGAD